MNNGTKWPEQEIRRAGITSIATPSQSVRTFRQGARGEGAMLNGKTIGSSPILNSSKHSATISFSGDFVEVHSSGEKSIEFSRELLPQVVAACNKHGCFRILGIMNSTVPIEAVEAFEHIELFKSLGIGQKYRIAWVELNADATDMAEFLEGLLISRNLPARHFASVADAKSWLRERT